MKILSKDPLKKPCACGSGRKARYCCSREESGQRKNELLRKRSLLARKKITRELIKFSKDFELEEILPEAWFFFAESQIEEAAEAMSPIFLPWFYYRWDLRMDYDSIGGLHRDHSVAAVYLRRHGHALDKIERECIESGMRTPISFYKVMDCVPGQEVTVKDLLRDDDYPEIQLTDIGLSNSSRQGAIFMGLVFQVHGAATVEGIAPLMIPPEYTREILTLKDDIKDDCGTICDESLGDWEDEILNLYWSLDDRKNQKPVLTNTSGELIKLQTIYFDIKDKAVALKALVPLARDPALMKETLAQLEMPEIPAEIKFKWLSASPSKKLQGRTIYGDITVTGNEIIVSVNSDERAARIKKEISKRLAGNAIFRMESYLGSDASIRDSSDAPNSRQGEPVHPSEMPEDVKSSIVGMASVHKKKWFDVPIPMLSGKSPREAAKTEKGRQQLEILIETYSFRHAGIPDNPVAALFNPTEEEIRLELGL